MKLIAGILMGATTLAGAELLKEYAALQSCNSVQSIAINETGIQSDVTAAFFKMLRSDTPEANFKALFESSAHDAGRIYALIGLHKIESPYFEKALAQYMSCKPVKFIIQDTVEDLTPDTIFSQLKDGSLYGSLFGTVLRPPAKPK